MRDDCVIEINKVNHAYECKCFKYVKPTCRLDEGKHESPSSVRINEYLIM